MKLTLTDDEGIVLEIWNVEDDFGDVQRQLARTFMAQQIAEAIAKAKAQAKA